MRGSKASLVIRQGKEQQFKPMLYIIPVDRSSRYESEMNTAFEKLERQYPGILLHPNSDGWEVVIPRKYHEGHEAHFARVTEKYIDYFLLQNIPDWEVHHMMAKYFTTTRAFEMTKSSVTP